MASLDDFTLREINFIENTIGTSMGSVAGNDEKPQGMFLAALATVHKKRENPAFTLEDALDLTLTELQDILPKDEEEDAPGEA